MFLPRVHHRTAAPPATAFESMVSEVPAYQEPLLRRSSYGAHSVSRNKLSSGGPRPVTKEDRKYGTCVLRANCNAIHKLVMYPDARNMIGHTNGT